jgi:hypothetical protein
MGLTALPETRGPWRQLLGATEPLNQLLCLALNAVKPLLLSRLCGLLLNLCYDRDTTYLLAERDGLHFLDILAHLLAQEWRRQLQQDASDLEAGVGGATPWSAGTRAAAAGNATATLADELLDDGGLPTALVFLVEVAELVSGYDTPAIVLPDRDREGAANADGDQAVGRRVVRPGLRTTSRRLTPPHVASLAMIAGSGLRAVI